MSDFENREERNKDQNGKYSRFGFRCTQNKL